MANEQLKARIGAELALRSWQWKDLAVKTGLGVNTFPGWWRGRVPDTKSLEKVASVLGVPLSQLLDEPAPTAPVERRQVNLESEPLIEIVGKVYATPFRYSVQNGFGQFVKGRPGEQDCFALIVEGDSMEPVYLPGEIIICRPAPNVSLNPYTDDDDAPKYVPYSEMRKYHNEDAIVVHNGETNLKRIQVEQKRGPMYDLWMMSLNPKSERVKVRFGDEWKVDAFVVRRLPRPSPE